MPDLVLSGRTHEGRPTYCERRAAGDPEPDRAVVVRYAVERAQADGWAWDDLTATAQAERIGEARVRLTPRSAVPAAVAAFPAKWRAEGEASELLPTTRALARRHADELEAALTGQEDTDG